MDNEDYPKIAILGGGPIGIESALYARFLGYPVTVYEQGEICQSVREWGHIEMFSPFGMNSSPLGRSALEAQHPDRKLPLADVFQTGQQWIDQYLEPLAKSDLVGPVFQTTTRIESVARDTPLINEDRPRHQVPFRILIRDNQGRQRLESADIVIDTTGTWGNANPIGSGGMPAMGEQDLDIGSDTIFTHQIPTPQQLAKTTRRNFVVVGSGYSAATSIVQLNQLHRQDHNVQCVWLTRGPASETGPMNLIENDRLEDRNQLASSANQIATNADWLDWRPSIEVDSIDFVEGHFTLRLSSQESLQTDHLIANTGFQGNYGILEPLHIHRCYVSGGPMAWAASIAHTGDDCLQQKSTGAQALATTEPGFFIAGSKSYGRDPRFLFQTGLQQVRDIFRLVSERETLDLYIAMQPNLTSG